MRHFDRYVLMMFVKYLLIIMLVILAATVLFTGVQDFDRFSENNASIAQVAVFQLIQLPVKMMNTLPITAVVASIVTVMILMRSKEMLAYVSLGGRIARLLAPFLIVSVVLSAAILVFEHRVYPYVKIAQSKYITENIQKGTYTVQDKLVDMWIVDNEERLVHVELIDPIGKNIMGVKEYMINNTFQVETVISISNAVFNGNQWVLHDVKSTDLMLLPPQTIVESELLIDSDLFDDLTSMSGRWRKELLPSELARMIHVMNNHGLNAVEYEMLLYAIYANALSVIALVVLVVPIGIDFSRRYSPIKSTIFSFGFGMAYWGTYAAFNSFGSSGIMPPLVANFVPLAIFLMVGIAVLIWREQAQ